jgi:hypothetical protein
MTYLLGFRPDFLVRMNKREDCFDVDIKLGMILELTPYPEAPL